MNLTLHVWRQKDADDPGRLVIYAAKDISSDMSFLEMLDVVNEGIILSGGEPIAFENDCREGICGSCGCLVNGVAHGPQRGTALCQLHMRHFKDGDEIFIEPFRARAFPVVKDLVVDRSPLDRIIQSGGFITAPTGSAPEANDTPIPKPVQDQAMDAAACIGCGACVAACPNASAMLFTAGKVSHLGLLPQGQPERYRRVVEMVKTQDQFFGNCTNAGECEAVCPKRISLFFISRLNRDILKATIIAGRDLGRPAGAL